MRLSIYKLRHHPTSHMMVHNRWVVIDGISPYGNHDSAPSRNHIKMSICFKSVEGDKDETPQNIFAKRMRKLKSIYQSKA